MILTARALKPESWIGVPLGLAILASLFFATPLRVFGLQAPEPVFALAPAFAWAFIRPSMLPPLALLAMGLVLDLLWGTPLGFWALCLLGAHALVLVARTSLSGQGFWMLWVWYALACGAAFGLGFALMALMAGNAPELVGLAAQWLVSAALFPWAYQLIDRFEDADVRFR